MELPPLTSGPPAPGKRFVVTAPEYTGTSVRHQVCLPTDWTPDWKAKGLSWPVIVEYTGNSFWPLCTGEVEDAALGYGLGDGKCIWVVLPFVSEDHKNNRVSWWGDEEATVDYAKVNVPRICAEYGGDPSKVVLCGFSRGAIAVNYIGLHDDEIANLWCGFMSHDHYDGQSPWPQTRWGWPHERFKKSAAQRLDRLKGRPVLVSGNENMADAVKKCLGDRVSRARFTFVSVPVKKIFPEDPNPIIKGTHTDRWMFRDSSERQQERLWLAETFKNAPARTAAADATPVSVARRVITATKTEQPADYLRDIPLPTTKPIVADGKGVFTFDAQSATIHGDPVGYPMSYNAGSQSLENWNQAEDYPWWSVKFAKPGTYQVDITYACHKGQVQGGGDYTIEVAGQKLKATAIPTDYSWTKFRTDHVGTITIGTAKEGELSVHTHRNGVSMGVLNLRSVVLTPVN